MEDTAVIISIKGRQKLTGQDEDRMELVTVGRLAGGPESGYVLSYQESELTGMAGTHTTFTIRPDRITLLREGTVNTEMIFEEGRKHLSVYDTPYGSLEVGVSARRVRSSIGLTGGDLDVAYTMEIDHMVTGQNLFHIHVRQDGVPIAQ